MQARTENLRRTESECDSVFASENESVQIPEIPSRKQKSCIDAVVDEGWDDFHENFMSRDSGLRSFQLEPDTGGI